MSPLKSALALSAAAIGATQVAVAVGGPPAVPLGACALGLLAVVESVALIAIDWNAFPPQRRRTRGLARLVFYGLNPSLAGLIVAATLGGWMLAEHSSNGSNQALVSLLALVVALPPVAAMDWRHVHTRSFAIPVIAAVAIAMLGLALMLDAVSIAFLAIALALLALGYAGLKEGDNLDGDIASVRFVVGGAVGSAILISAGFAVLTIHLLLANT
jgi:hypothetical protein